MYLKQTNMELNINEIASAKIKEMEESGAIRKRIEDGVEETINKAIASACEDYNFMNQISRNITSLLGEVAKNINFSAYANFLSMRMNEQIEKYVKTDMINMMRDSFEKTYFNIQEDIKLSDILSKYKEYIANVLDDDDKKEWGHIDFSFEREYSLFIKIKAGRPDKKRYDSFDKGIEMCLFKSHLKDGKAKIIWVRCRDNDFKTSMNLSDLSDFEILMFNLMFTQTEIEVDIDEDFYFDADFENEYY